jgi:hypothetical protein
LTHWIGPGWVRGCIRGSFTVTVTVALASPVAELQQSGGILIDNSKEGHFDRFSATIADNDSWASPGGFLGGLRAGTRRVPDPRTASEGEAMADLLNLAMLISASVGSMAFGILAAYGILRAGFALMRRQPRPAAVKTRPEVARVS